MVLCNAFTNTFYKRVVGNMSNAICQSLRSPIKRLANLRRAYPISTSLVHNETILVKNNDEFVNKVKAVPAVIAIKNGIIVDKFIGLVDADMITGLIDRMAGKKKESA
ncbi:hypothetical protein HF086_005697 [Spodoptera exigua]|uniref:Uncharacterized protein n=1 Tax=Spodoptera exigua TaxID=7107 RepID=A0A922SNN2_SPOEX|nr:hypothetical protein HF086_005697 [Spodoptera exigua]